MDSWRRVGVLLAMLVLVGGCTPSAGDEPTPSPTPVKFTPAESGVERQEREDYAAAEKSYREFQAAYLRLAANGGANAANTTMKDTAAGPYLQTHLEVLQGIKKSNVHLEGESSIRYVHHVQHSDTRLVLDACEDTRDSALRYKSGKKFAGGSLDTVRLEVRKESGLWKIWNGDAKTVSEC